MGILFRLLLVLVVFTSCAAAEEVRLLSYNVRHGVDFAGKPALERQAKILKESGASLIALQEIDKVCRRSGGVDQTARFAELTESQGKFGAFMDYDGGRYGLAMLSRLAIKDSSVVRLPDGREPRVALVLDVETERGNRLLVANVHFDWTSEKLRIPQAAALLAHLKDRDLPAVVLGDYNARPGSPTLKLFTDAGFRFAEKPNDARFTFNAQRPTVEIDHIAVRDGGGLRLTAKSISVLPEAEASDHRPIAATIVLGPAE